MEQILLELLKQSAVVVVMGVGLWAQWKEKKELRREIKDNAKFHREEMKDKDDNHSEALDKQAKLIDERDSNVLDTLKTVRDFYQQNK